MALDLIWLYTIQISRVANISLWRLTSLWKAPSYDRQSKVEFSSILLRLSF